MSPSCKSCVFECVCVNPQTHNLVAHYFNVIFLASIAFPSMLEEEQFLLYARDTFHQSNQNRNTQNENLSGIDDSFRPVVDSSWIRA